MSLVRPFRGLRPRPEMAHKVASPPYDVLSSSEARALAANNPLSFLRVNKAEIDFDEGSDPYGREVYQRGKDNLQSLIDQKVMVRDPEDCFYLYRLTWQGQSQTGLVCLTSVDEYDKGLIKKHEHTRPVKVNDRANHIDFIQAQVGPVFSTFRTTATIADLFTRLTSGAPEVDFTTPDQVQHQLWVVRQQSDREAIINGFAVLKCLYIADGHHRSAAASEVCRRRRETNPNTTGQEVYNFFLNVLFADAELRILPYNRVVTELNGLSEAELLEKCQDKFELGSSDQPVEPNRPHSYGLYCNRQWHKLTAKEMTFDPNHPTDSIDAAILSNNLIEPLLGISDPKTDERIDFVGGIRGVTELVKLVDSGDYKAAFSLYPTSIAQLLAVADAGEVMPPKSTWFEPKLRSGMVVNLLND